MDYIRDTSIPVLFEQQCTTAKLQLSLYVLKHKIGKDTVTHSQLFKVMKSCHFQEKGCHWKSSCELK